MARLKTWVVVADASHARLFRWDDGEQTVEPITGQELFGENRPGRDALADRPGRSQGPVTGPQHALAPHTDPREVDKRHFLHALAQKLDGAVRHGETDKLVVIAPPKALGALRAGLTPLAGKAVVADVAKDLTHLPPADISEHVRAAFATE